MCVADEAALAAFCACACLPACLDCLPSSPICSSALPILVFSLRLMTSRADSGGQRVGKKEAGRWVVGGVFVILDSLGVDIQRAH